MSTGLRLDKESSDQFMIAQFSPRYETLSITLLNQHLISKAKFRNSTLYFHTPAANILIMRQYTQERRMTST